MLVVDASVACKWLVQEIDSNRAVRLLHAATAMVAPDLVVTEVANALWRKVRSREVDIGHAIEALDNLGKFLSELVPGAQLGRQALAIAHELNHPVYDCMYLALAVQREASVVSADARLIQKVSGTKWAGQVVALHTYPAEG